MILIQSGPVTPGKAEKPGESPNWAFDKYNTVNTFSCKNLNTESSKFERKKKETARENGSGALNFCLVGMSGAERRNGSLKNWSVFAKVRSKELSIFNILRAYGLKFMKFGPNLGCRTENSLNCWRNFSRRSQNVLFLLKVGV